MQEAILRMKRADWMRPLLELLEGQARRAGQAGLSTGQKALAAHLFEVIINEVSSTAQRMTLTFFKQANRDI